MIRNLIPGALAIGLAATSSAQDSTAADAKPAEATTPPIEVPAAPALDPADIKTRSSFAFGLRSGAAFAEDVGRFGVTLDDLDTDAYLKGFLAGFKQDQEGVNEEELGAAMQALGDMLQKREADLAKANLDAGEKFLAENAKREGVVTTDSGLQYEVLEKGGEEKYVEPKEGEGSKQFLVHYKGTLIDGTEFDASPEGEPVPMTLEVVDGFKEALTTMPVGAKWKLYMPAKLAYGEQRRSAEIGPNSTLVFELQLQSIEDAPEPQGMPFPMPQMQGE